MLILSLSQKITPQNLNILKKQFPYILTESPALLSRQNFAQAAAFLKEKNAGQRSSVKATALNMTHPCCQRTRYRSVTIASCQ
jgi:hypothetical protein